MYQVGKDRPRLFGWKGKTKLPMDGHTDPRCHSRNPGGSGSVLEWFCLTPMVRSSQTALYSNLAFSSYWASTLIPTCIWVICFSDLPTTSSCSPSLVLLVFSHLTFLQSAPACRWVVLPTEEASRFRIGPCLQYHNNRRKLRNLLAQTLSFDFISIAQKSWRNDIGAEE